MTYRAFIDESSANRDHDQQEYLLCAALVADNDCEQVREYLRPLLLPGQIKLHWTDESGPRRHKIVKRIVELGPMSVVIAHLGARTRKNERYRRKCLETLYTELLAMDVLDATLESRTPKQDKADFEHIVAAQDQWLDKRLRIRHLRGGDEPLLWIADTVLGAVNSAHLGDSSYLDLLQPTLLLETRTPESRTP